MRGAFVFGIGSASDIDEQISDLTRNETFVALAKLAREVKESTTSNQTHSCRKQGRFAREPGR
jgi:hypothetical protein